MAATESKTEPQEVEVAVENHPVPEPLNYKTWELKVSVHCEACKRKVKKILHKIEGVYETEIDLKQQKVTVKGDVEADTLIKRLIKKTGKHAELWPEKADKKEKRKGKSKNKEKQSNDNNNDEENSEESINCGNQDKEAQAQEGDDGGSTCSSTNIKVVEVGSVIKANNEGGGGGLPIHVKTAVSGVVQVKEIKPEVRQTATLPAGNQTAAVDKKSGEENEAGGEKSSGSGSGSKKKKKNGHKAGNQNNIADNVQNCEPHASNDAPPPADRGSAPAPAPSHVPNHENGPYYQHGTGPIAPPNQSTPRYHPSGYQYPPTQFYAAPPVYAVSHNTTHPSGTYAAAYSALPPQNSYAYVHPGVGNWMDQQQYQRYDLDYESSSSYASSRPSDSFELFSDENPNGCSIM